VRILVDGGAFSGQTGDATAGFWDSFLPALMQRLPRAEICVLHRAAPGPRPDGASVRDLFAPPVDFEASALEDRRLRRLCRLLEADVFLSTCHTSAGIDTPSLFLGAGAPPRGRGPRDSSRRAARMAARHVAVGGAEAARLAAALGLPLSLFRVADGPITTVADAAAAALEELRAPKPLLDEAQIARRISEEQSTAALALRQRAAGERRALWRYRRARWARAAGQPGRYLEYLGRLLRRAG
jgi:hypothetical protein